MQNIQTASQTSTGQNRVAIVGAGLIGSFLAAVLATDSALELMLYGREQAGLDLAAYGLRANWQHQRRHYGTDPVTVAYFSHFQSLVQADIVLLTVKATALLTVLHQIRPFIRPGVPVIALQNGVGILDIVQSQLSNPCYRALVPFNVVRSQPGLFVQTSGGALIWPQGRDPLLAVLADSFRRAQLPVTVETDMRAAEYGKLLLNLNNALNALSDLPLRSQLLQRPWRLLLAAAMTEWLTVCRQLNVIPRGYTAVSPDWLPRLLRSPNWLFRRLAARMLRVDPEARLSMSADFTRGVRTEIQFLNGAVAALGRQHRLATPVNQRITDLVLAHEAGAGQPVDATQLCRQLGLLQ